MREKVRDKDRINHIVEAINAIVEYKDKYTLQEAQANPIIYYGFVKYVEIIGESTTRQMRPRAFMPRVKPDREKHSFSRSTQSFVQLSASG